MICAGQRHTEFERDGPQANVLHERYVYDQLAGRFRQHTNKGYEDHDLLT